MTRCGVHDKASTTTARHRRQPFLGEMAASHSTASPTISLQSHSSRRTALIGAMKPGLSHISRPLGDNMFMGSMDGIYRVQLGLQSHCTMTSLKDNAAGQVHNFIVGWERGRTRKQQLLSTPCMVETGKETYAHLLQRSPLCRYSCCRRRRCRRRRKGYPGERERDSAG